MSKTVVKIGSFEVDDAHLHAGADRAGTLSIPCKSDPDLCMQLDGWDEHTSIPAILMANSRCCTSSTTIGRRTPG